MTNQEVWVFYVFVFASLISVLAVTEIGQAQYPSYSYGPTTNPTSSSTSTPFPSATSS